MAYPKPNDVSIMENSVAKLSWKMEMRMATLDPKEAESAMPKMNLQTFCMHFPVEKHVQSSFLFVMPQKVTEHQKYRSVFNVSQSCKQDSSS